MRRSGYAAVIIFACSLTAWLPATARAEDEVVKPAPRTVIQIGDASIVLITANNHLYAFVDRVADNAPLPDAELSIDSADGGSLPIAKATEGLFSAPFDRTGHMHDAFMVSLRSPEATGDAPAEIAYDDLPDSSDTDTKPGLLSKLWIALVSAGIGATVSGLLVVRRRSGSKPAVAASVGTAQTA